MTGCCRSLFGCSPRPSPSYIGSGARVDGSRGLCAVNTERHASPQSDLYYKAVLAVLGGDRRNIKYNIGLAGKHLLIISRGEFQWCGLERVDVLICRLLTSVWHRWDQDRKLICSGAWQVREETVLASPGPLLSTSGNTWISSPSPDGSLSPYTASLSCMHSFYHMFQL